MMEQVERINRAALSGSLRPDFHSHSTASDGSLTPAALIERAHASGINLLALTDHESINGITEASRRADSLGMGFIPGIEVSTAGEDEVHILGYFVNDGMRELSALLRSVSLDRKRRAGRFIERFSQLGMPITMEELQIPKGTDCNRPLVARALVKKGYVASVREAFDRYLAVGKPGYIPREKADTLDVVRMLRREGAVPVLAHPGIIKSPALKSPERLSQLKEAGLLGIEAFHSQHRRAECLRWEAVARSMNLLVTGGSDFHTQGDGHGDLGCVLQHWAAADRDSRELLRAGVTAGRVHEPAS